MSDYKFKVGDRVMVNFTDPNRFQVGDMGTVLYTDSNPFFSVKLDKYSKNLHNCIRLCENGHGWHFKEHELQLIERPNKDNYFEEQSAIDYLKSLGYTITKTFFLFIFVGMAVSCLDKSVIPFDSLDNCADCFNTDYCTLVEQGDETELEFGLSPLRGVSVISDFSALVSSTTDGTTANKLVDSGATFTTDGILIGAIVKNTTDDTYATITAIDDDNTLSLSADIFISGEDYAILNWVFGGSGTLGTNLTWDVNAESVTYTNLDCYLSNPNLQTGAYYRFKYSGTRTAGTQRLSFTNGTGLPATTYDQFGNIPSNEGSVVFFKAIGTQFRMASLVPFTSSTITLTAVELVPMSTTSFTLQDCTTGSVFYTSDENDVEYNTLVKYTDNPDAGFYGKVTLDWDSYSLSDGCYCLCVKDESDITNNYVKNGTFANTNFWAFTNVGASGWNIATNELNKAKDATSGTDKAETTLITALDATECYVLSFDLNSDNGSEVEVRYDTATVTDQLLETVTIPIGASTAEIDITGLDITVLKLWAASDDEEFSIDNLVLAKGADCVNCSCLSSCISLSANHDNTIMQGCNLLLEGTCDNNAFGFNFTDLSFTHRLRVVGKIRNMTFETESDYYLKSNGEKVLIYADTQENLELQILDLPAYVHSAVNMMLLCDTFTIDGVEYVKVGEYAPNWRKSSAKAPVIVTIAKATQNRFNTFS
jgi:hypothetical protein